MRACRFALLLLVLLTSAVFVAVEVTARVSSSTEVPQSARLYFLVSIGICLGAAAVLWIGERLRRLEGLIAAYSLATNSARAPRTDDRNRGRDGDARDAKILDLFSQD